MAAFAIEACYASGVLGDVDLATQSLRRLEMVSVSGQLARYGDGLVITQILLRTRL